MVLMVAGMLGNEFRKGTNDQAFQRILWQLRDQEDRNKKAQLNQKQETESDAVADYALSIISVEQSDQFQSEITVFQEATTEALIHQEKLIEKARIELQEVIDQAYILEDGRKAFKDREGLKVYDIDGNELGETIITADEIPDHHPRIEDLLERREQLQILEREQTEILEFQDKLDEARDRLDRGDLTQQEFKDLRDDIYDSAPQAVRDIAEGRGFEFETSPDPNVPASPVVSEIEINLDDELASLPKPSTGIPGLQF